MYCLEAFLIWLHRSRGSLERLVTMQLPKTGSAVFFALALTMKCLAAVAAEPIQPIIMPDDLDFAQVELGKKLFFEPRLSKSGFISCNSCHNLSTGGVDNLVTSIGHGWQQGPINSPTVLNSSYNLAQFWDGRAKDLQEQAAGPIANPGEMAFDHSLAVSVLESIPGYVDEFEQVFGSAGVNIDRITAAIAEFERSLVTPNSRFDQWLMGDANAINTAEREGYELFKSVGCASCHNGPAVGGESFMKTGLVKPYVTDNPAQGRVEVSGQEADRYSFKVPTLRNVEQTYPYFHDGSVFDLDEAVAIMADIQLGQDLSDLQIEKISGFLRTLTGKMPAMTLPQLPPSNKNTPRPEPFGP